LIDEIGVISSRRNKGVGEKLVTKLSEWFKDRQALRIELKVLDKNKHGEAFWSKMGFACFTKQMHKNI
jgi:GNAT superfamily N-acetyltransferase